MSDFFRILVTLLVAANPFLLAAAISGGRPSREIVVQAAVTAFVILVVAAAVAEPMLNRLSIEPESFRIAAGVVMLVTGAAAAFPFGSPRRIAVAANGGETKFRVVPAVFPIGWPGIASAGAVAAGMNYGADSGVAVTALAAVAAVAISIAFVAWLAPANRMLSLTAGRFCGGVLVVLAVDLIIAGVQDV